MECKTVFILTTHKKSICLRNPKAKPTTMKKQTKGSAGAVRKQPLPEHFSIHYQVSFFNPKRL